MSSIFEGVAPTAFGAGGNSNEGIDFSAAHTGTIDAVSWYQPAAGGPASVTATLYDTQTHAVLATQLSGALVPGAWNVIPFGASVPITPGKLYTASLFVPPGTIGFSAARMANHVFNSSGDLAGLRGTGRYDAGVVPAFPTTFSGGFDAYGVDVSFTQTPTCPECPPCPPTEGFLINLTSPGFVAIVTGLAGCVFGALAQTPAGVPCRQCVLLPTQQIPWDNCGPCEEGCDGQAAFAIREVYGSDTFPLPAAQKTWSKCGPRYTVARVVVSVTRCVPGMDERGEPPNCDAELAAAIILENDRTAVRQGLACCLNAASIATPAFLSEWLISPSVTVGELGQCAGSETEFLVGVRSCICPD